jgi:hypothetical protein
MNYRLSPDVAWRKVDDELFAITPDGMLHNVQSAVGVTIFELLMAGSSLADIATAVEAEFAVDKATAQADLDQFVVALLAKGILVPE